MTTTLLTEPIVLEFAVSMAEQSCVQSIKRTVNALDGVDACQIDLASQRVVVQGRVPPSSVQKALKASGRQVIVRGMGSLSDASGETVAGVCVFESHQPSKIHGIARLVQAGELCVFDLTIQHTHLQRPPKDASDWHVYVARSGDVSRGPESTGGLLRHIGQLNVDSQGYGDLFTELKDFRLQDSIGRAMVIAPALPTATMLSHQEKREALQLGPGVLAGVIARSAGAWGNAKQVCSCSGLNLWQEDRKLQQSSVL
ncbi:uncharacterized protein L969DRAFT_94910 [Mixia osmundae IAM 14324]|uniref:Superoxide dismutase 1 copper chaperone n=1 Tax=Mixia osmundae (strain CBS 9802 / IAM 14324 / JCM 22182 / KY 12970) TaxID=764103 RepID=G7E1Y7_MIXOS|nr:uncharacterized protein L969DRAFT_94910 [Mixia osmundae IAM 14324]KEI38720.1 hypothetical protein L969DRAFT_94910 [Mixia osmundae IAM 14324]GAA96824.1 hypothetical protein E5Q_03496 [Mixia osmundae IAM 14324]